MVWLKSELAVAFFAIACGAFLPTTAAARITCCEVDGKRTCGDPAPQACLAREKTEFNKGGAAMRVEAPLTAEQRAARDAEAARKKEEELQAAEQARKDQALLDSYTTEKDIDSARDRAIADIEKNAEQARNRLETAAKKKQQLDHEKEFFQNKPLPPLLKKQIEANEAEIAAQQKTLSEKDGNIVSIRERYAADKARFIRLTGGKAAAKR